MSKTFPSRTPPAPFSKKWQSGTCFHVRSSPLRRLPFIQKRQDFPLPPTEPEAAPGAGPLARAGLEVRLPEPSLLELVSREPDLLELPESPPDDGKG